MKAHNLQVTGSLTTGGEAIGSISSSVATTTLGLGSRLTTIEGKSLVSGSSQVDVMSTTNISRLATTGSNTFQGLQTVNGSLVVTGSLTAQQFIVSSSVTYLTESFASGSHKFGDSSDDYHDFTGSVRINGTLVSTSTTLISGSAQVDVMSTTNIARLATTGSNTFSGLIAIGGTNDGAGTLYVTASANTNAARLRNNDASYGTLDVLNSNASGIGIYAVANKHFISGSLGINTTSPGDVIDVRKNQNATTNFYFRNTDTTSAASRAYLNVIAGDSTISMMALHGDNVFIAGTSGKDMYIQQNPGGAVNMAIKSNGYVGISTTSPTSTLQLGDVFGLAQDVNSGYLQANLATSTGTYIKSQYGVRIHLDSALGLIRFMRAGSGTAATAFTLTESMRITNTGGLYINRASYLGDGYGLVIGSDDANLQCSAMFVKNNSNNCLNFFNASGAYVASISINASTVSYGTGSDYRLKEDLKTFNGLEKLSAIKVYDFKYRAEGDRMEGVIAHELQEVIPYAVSGHKDELDNQGNIKIQNVDYSKIVPVLIKSIQEQQQIISDLKDRITTLENK